jgi:DNA-binding transcriptional ArsR family regulator
MKADPPEGDIRRRRHPMDFSIGDIGRFLATREKGREVRVSVENSLARLEAGEELLLNFARVDAVTVSFADELVGKLASDRAAGQYSDHGMAVCEVNEDVRETLDVVLRRRRLALASLEQGGRLTILGEAEAWLDATVEEALRLRSFRAADLAEALGMTPSAVNNRLRAALATGAITRDRIVPDRGGKEFVYKVAVPVHA